MLCIRQTYGNGLQVQYYCTGHEVYQVEDSRLGSLTFSPPLEQIRGLWNVATGRDCRFCCPAPSPRSNTSIAVAIGPSGGGDAAGTRTDLDSTMEPGPRLFASVTGGRPGGVSESPTLMAARDQHPSQIAAASSDWGTGTQGANARKQIEDSL